MGDVVDSIRKLIKGISEGELDLDHTVYSQLFKFLKQTPTLVLRDHIEQCSNITKVLLDFSLSDPSLAPDLKATLEKFRDTYVGYLELQHAVVKDMEQLIAKILLILEQNDQLQHFFQNSP